MRVLVGPGRQADELARLGTALRHRSARTVESADAAVSLLSDAHALSGGSPPPAMMVGMAIHDRVRLRPSQTRATWPPQPTCAAQLSTRTHRGGTSTVRELTHLITGLMPCSFDHRPQPPTAYALGALHGQRQLFVPYR
jgi:hypothetical protein